MDLVGLPEEGLPSGQGLSFLLNKALLYREKELLLVALIPVKRLLFHRERMRPVTHPTSQTTLMLNQSKINRIMGKHFNANNGGDLLFHNYKTGSGGCRKGPVKITDKWLIDKFKRAVAAGEDVSKTLWFCLKCKYPKRACRCSSMKVKGAVHYAPSGEWGGEKVNCGRYFTSNVAHSADISQVTCKYCLKQIKK